MIEWTRGKPAKAYEMVWAWDGVCVFMAYVGTFGRWFDNNDHPVRREITHWQEIEIPEPPKEES